MKVADKRFVADALHACLVQVLISKHSECRADGMTDEEANAWVARSPAVKDAEAALVLLGFRAGRLAEAR